MTAPISNTCFTFKLKIRILKSEKNSKFKFSNVQNSMTWIQLWMFRDFGHLILFRISNFVLRISKTEGPVSMCKAIDNSY